jgi:hypothetical protein
MIIFHYEYLLPFGNFKIFLCKEIEDQRYNNTTYGDSMYLGGDNSSPNKHNIASKYGLTGMKKYPAPQPNTSSSYGAKNPRCTTCKSEADYFQYNKQLQNFLM